MTRSSGLHFLLIFGLVLARGQASVATGQPVTPRQHTAKALNSRLAEVKFEGAQLTEVIRFLSHQTGVNIIIDPAVYLSVGKGPTTGAGPSPGGESPPQPQTSAAVQPHRADVEAGKPLASEGPGITLHLKNVPLKVVLKYVLRYKNLRYIVEDYAIVIVPIGRAFPEELITEVFQVRTGSFGTVSHVRPTAGQSL